MKGRRKVYRLQRNNSPSIPLPPIEHAEVINVHLKNILFFLHFALVKGCYRHVSQNDHTATAIYKVLRVQAMALFVLKESIKDSLKCFPHNNPFLFKKCKGCVNVSCWSMKHVQIVMWVNSTPARGLFTEALQYWLYM